VCAHKTLS